QEPPKFDGGHNPDVAYKWLQETERIFRVVEATEAQKVMLATHRLIDDADFWWGNTRQRMIAAGTLMTWNNFKNEFLAKYFPADVKTKKEIEFLKLEQGSMTVAEYAKKFDELSRFCPHINAAEAEASKCVKFEGGLRPDIKKAVGYQEIRSFASLVNKSRIYEEDSKASSNYYKARGDKINAGQNRSKPYEVQRGDRKDKHKNHTGKGKSGGEGSNNPRCFRCGGTGHKIAECKNEAPKCFRCGEPGHYANECKNGVTCFNCGDPGHISTQCDKPKKIKDNATGRGRVFALDGERHSDADNLIRGTCIINNTTLVAMIDTGATHSFISLDCARKLGLEVSPMNGRMIIEIPAKDSVITNLVVLNCPLSIFEKHFGMDLVCLPLRNMDVILGMNWLKYNKVHIDCLNGTVLFPEPTKDANLETVTAGQVKKLINEEALVLMICASLITEEKLEAVELPVVNFQMSSPMISATYRQRERWSLPLTYFQAPVLYRWHLT
ncbi:hypothetical protein TSUD_420210, partial [Trifolium subterraneum]